MTRARRLVPPSLTLLLAAQLAGQEPTAQARAGPLTLADAARAALEADPLLRSNLARADANAAGEGAARAGRLPRLSLEASALRFGEPMVVAPLHGFDPTSPPEFDRTLAQGSLTLGYTLFDGGATSARVDGARALSDAARANVEDARAGVLEGVAEAYLTALTAADVLDAELERVRALESERERAARLLAEGAAPRLQLLRAEAELGAARAAASAAGARLDLARARLALLTGLPEETVRAERLQDPPASPAPGLTGVSPSHPALEAARGRAEAARAAVAEARAAFLPRVAALGRLQEFGGAGTGFSTEWQGGFQVEYPLFTGGARGHALEKSRAELEQAEAETELAARRVEEARLAADAAEREARALAVALEDAVASYEELVRVEALALSEGAGVQGDFLRAQAGLLEARSGRAQARRAALLALVRRARALGQLTLAWIEDLTEVAP